MICRSLSVYCEILLATVIQLPHFVNGTHVSQYVFHIKKLDNIFSLPPTSIIQLSSKSVFVYCLGQV